MLLATVLGSGVALLDATVVSIALPRIGRELGGGLGALQWIINGYTLTLAAFILLGGALGDLFGRRRVFVTGAVWFAAASLLCAVAPSAPVLVGARALQGVGGALMAPGSLAIISASFAAQDRSRRSARGRASAGWPARPGRSSAAGCSRWRRWRWVFLVNLPLIAVVVLVALRHVPETPRPGADPRLDVPARSPARPALAALTYGLVALGASGTSARRCSRWPPARW